jgi:hypothetical protein
MTVIIVKGIFNIYFKNIITKRLYTLCNDRNDIDKHIYIDYIIYSRFKLNSPISI